MNVNPSNTGDSIKAKIADEARIAAARQVLKFEGKKWPNCEKAAVRNVNIQEGLLLNFEIYKLPIMVKTKDGKIIPLDLEPSDTISAINEVIQKETGPKPEKQCLKLGSKELTSPYTTAESYIIKAGSTLMFEAHVNNIR